MLDSLQLTADIDGDPGSTSCKDGALGSIVVMPDGGGFYVTGEGVNTADEKSTYGVADWASGDLNGTFFTNLLGDDNDPILRGALILSPMPMPGDANSDGSVSIGDLAVMASNWDQYGKTWCDGDFSRDGRVYIGDLSILAGNWGWSSQEPAPIPEPATLSLLCFGALAVLRRKR